MTNNQRAMIFAIAKKKNIDIHDIINIRYNKTSTKKLSNREINDLISLLQGKNSMLVMETGVEYITPRQAYFIKSLFKDCNFFDDKARLWILRANSLKSLQNGSSFNNDDLLKNMRLQEANVLITSLIRLKKSLK